MGNEKDALACALISLVDEELEPDAALGLGVFGALAAKEEVREAVGGDVAEGGSLSAGCMDYVRYVLATMMTDVPVAPTFFVEGPGAPGARDHGGAAAAAASAAEQAASDPVADLLGLVEIGLGRQADTAQDNRARSQAIRRLRREDPELIRRTPVPGSHLEEPWEQWQHLLDRLEADGVEREVYVCCCAEPLRWRAPLRADGAPVPCRVPLLPSLDAAASAIWRPGELTEARRRERYASAEDSATSGGGTAAAAHGSVLVRLACDFLCAKCQQQFVRDRSGADFTDEEIATWWRRLQLAPVRPDRSLARAAVLDMSADFGSGLPPHGAPLRSP